MDMPCQQDFHFFYVNVIFVFSVGDELQHLYYKFLPWEQLEDCSVTRPFLSLRRVTRPFAGESKIQNRLKIKPVPIEGVQWYMVAHQHTHLSSWHSQTPSASSMCSCLQAYEGGRVHHPSCAVMSSGRQKVDTSGWSPTIIIHKLYMFISKR